MLQCGQVSVRILARLRGLGIDLQLCNVGCSLMILVRRLGGNPSIASRAPSVVLTVMGGDKMKKSTFTRRRFVATSVVVPPSQHCDGLLLKDRLR
jgi:hypothetical protein